MIFPQAGFNPPKQRECILEFGAHSTSKPPWLDDLQAITLEGSARDNPEPDPLAILHLDNRLCMSRKGPVVVKGC